MRYLVKMIYDGSKFYGFQRLNNQPTIQKILEDALSVINKSSVTIKGAGRTDRGVHALGQCAHFELKFDLPEERLKKAINCLIKPYISIIEVKKIDNLLHARFSVIEKTYLYKIFQGEKNPFKEDYYFQFDKKLDINMMILASEILTRQASFKTFVCGYRDNYNLKINSIKIKKFRQEIEIEFKGKSFYRYMVRNLVGVLIEVGLRKLTLEDINSCFEHDKIIHYTTVPASGLYLKEIKYE